MDLKDLMILANNLRQERLLVTSEQQAIQNLNECVAKDCVQVHQCSWIKCQQRINLNKLTIARSSYSPANCCQKANALASTKFVEAQKVLKYQDVQSYGEFLHFLRCNPELIATCLIAGDQVAPDLVQSVCCSLVTGLYGTCLLTEDTEYVLQVLKCLMEMQLMLSEDPRRMLRNGSCAFSRLYLMFHEVLFSAKLFLSASLKEPVMQLLMEEEIYLDMDPDLALGRNPDDEMLKKLGREGHRKWTIDTLVTIVNHFIKSLREHWILFPNCIARLVHQMVAMLRKQNFADEKINAMCTDLIFTHLICPAIVCPERYSIVDAPVSAIQQFNLVQVGQIIQMLALGKNDGEVKYRELYCHFEKNCVSSLLEPLIEGSGKVLSQTHELKTDIPRLNRSSLMFTLQELNTFVSYFQLVVDQSSVEGSNRLDSAYKTQLTRLLSTLPITNTICDKNNSSSSTASPAESPKKGSSLLGSKGSKSRLARYNSADTNNTSPTDNPLPSSSSNNLTSTNGSASNSTSSTALNVSASTSTGGLTLTNQQSMSNSSSGTNCCNFLMSDDNRNIVQDVLMIPLPGAICGGDVIEVMSEQEVLALELPSHEHRHMQNNLSRLNRLNAVDGIILSNDIGLDQSNATVRGSGVGIEKRTRFSLSHEEGSLGNASDNIEVVSEAASNHSVASSLELEHEDQNDNLSDMTSANVSGRGSPNISGRDTPSSQVTEGGGGGNNPNNNNQNGGPNQNGGGGSNQNGGGSGYGNNHGGPGPNGGDSRPNNKFGGGGGAKILKQARNNDIQDKFCKFEIKKLLEGDETVSIISDTWSTDVLASDSEAVETSYERSYSGARNHHQPNQQQLPVLLERNNRIVLAPPTSDRDRDRERQPTDVASDAASESAWSTDVLASDSERTAEIDTDDCHSVARSDTDTARSEVDIDNIIENQASNQNLPRRYPSPLSPLVNISPIYAPQAVRRDINVVENSNMESPLSDGSVQLRTRNSSASSIGSNRPSGVNGLSSLLSSNPLNSTLNTFDSDSAFYNKLESTSNANSNLRFNPRNSMTNNDVFHSMNSPFVSAMATTARANGFMDGYHSFDNDRKFSDDITDSAERGLFRPIQDAGVQDGGLLQGQDPDLIPRDPLSIRHGDSLEDGLAQNFNVTGRGGSVSEYRRRTMEYVDSNANNQDLTPHSPGSNEDILNNPLEKTSDYSTARSDFQTDSSTQEGNVLSNLVSRITIVSERRVTVKNEGIISKPGTSTGAIPKSISFDSTADKYHPHRDFDVRRGMGNMFNKLKQGFKSRRGKGGRNDAERYDEFETRGNSRRQMGGVDDMETNDSRPVVNNQDTTEDILAKYRRKISSSSEAATSGASDSTGSGSGSSCSKKNNLRHNDNNNMDSILDKQRMRNSISTMEPSSCNYEDAKHKLRLVLSNVDLQSVDFNTSCALSENTLTTFLRILLSESHSTNLDDNSLSVQLYETMRSIEQLSRSTGLNGILDLCRDLQFEYQSRSLYVQYLVNTRRVLLQTLAYLERILNRLNSERTACDEHLLRVGVRAFLESREREMTTFCEDFCALRLSDEKIDLLETFLRAMHSSMLKDVNWQAASEEQLAAATLCIERIVMSRVYLNALYPNGEGDIARDNVLHAHMERLSRVVTVSHRDLRIPMRHQREAPWPRSQALLRQMSAYRAARDKARCVARCVTSVMHVLAMTSPRATPSADDLVPVLVFILIKANPPALLSTVEYVNSFYGNCLQGAEHYWWIQFCSAIEFIKTMDDN